MNQMSPRIRFGRPDRPVLGLLAIDASMKTLDYQQTLRDYESGGFKESNFIVRTLLNKPGSHVRLRRGLMKIVLAATILIFSFANQKADQGKYIHTREFTSPTEWIDTTTQGNAYMDLDCEFTEEGLTVTVLGCKVRGTRCDSPAEFKRLVEQKYQEEN
jgi:hypothetical protein